MIPVTRTLCILAAAGLAAGLAAGQDGAVPAGTGNPYLRARQLPARIMEFKADRDAIQPGQTVTLTWATENPINATIEPEIGRVTARGVREFAPPATTTYTLTVHGPNNEVLTRTVTVKVAGSAAAENSTSAAATKQIPRTADGKPDFSGVYDFSFGGRPAARGAGGARDPNAPVLKPGAEKFKVVRGPEDAGQYADCMPLAGPQAFMVPYQFELVQSADHLAILFGYPGTFRTIPTNGGLHPADPDPTWMGDSIGHWEGDTLVVDSVGFNDKTEINGFRHTDALHIIERFSRPSYNTLSYAATIEDPNVFAKPWTVNRTFALRTDLAKVDEFVCEHNTDYSKYFEKK